MAFNLQKDSKTDCLRNEGNLTTKPTEPSKLNFDNAQLRSHRDIGMSMMHTHHVNACILQLNMFVKHTT